ncbi:MAG: hypothetical protein WD512_00120, partial [Candidatus Paceibacterota bacterium]
MTIPVLSQTEFIALLKANGYEVASTKYWEDFNRLIFRKNGETFPLQMCEKYYFFTVCKICKDLGINTKHEHKICYEQVIEL